MPFPGFEQVLSLWQPDAGAVRGSLVLDATTSAVRARANIYEKAACLLRRHPSAIAIVVSGGEIRWWTKVAREGHPKDTHHHPVTQQMLICVPLLSHATGQY